MNQSQIKFAEIDGATSGDNEIVAAVAGAKIRVLNYAFVAAGAVGVKFQSASTDLTGLMSIAANGGISANGEPSGCFETAAGEALDLNHDAAVQVSGHLAYRLVT